MHLQMLRWIFVMPVGADHHQPTDPTATSDDKSGTMTSLSFQWHNFDFLMDNWVPLQCFMMTSSNGNIFLITGHLCGEFTGPQWIPHTKACDTELWYFFDLRLNKRLSKQPWGWWFETPSWSLWRQCNVAPWQVSVFNDTILTFWWITNSITMFSTNITFPFHISTM